MAKTYIDTVKYLIYADVDVDGMVDKPDVVGAIFGQTEGLLGEDLDLRDLQKNGRIGRIEVDLRSKGGRTRGVIKVPSSLDMVETCIIGAAIETVERVGPCEANIKISQVEDTRNIKRDKLIERSKGLLRTLINTELPESQEISDMVREEVKAAEITTYGRDKLPSGPGISRAEAIILVEGRADVVNLLKKDLANVVAIGGAKIPPTINALTREKEVTVFLDGDRGGDMILRELVQAGADIDFLARAPAGKEVEELTRKEVMKCLKNKLPFEQEAKDVGAPIPSSRNTIMPSSARPPAQPAPRQEQREQEPKPEPRREQRSEQRNERKKKRESIVERVEREAAKVKASIKEDSSPVSPELEKIVEKKLEKAKKEEMPDETEAPPKKLSKEELNDELIALSKSLKARFYNEQYEMIKELPVREVIKSLEEVKGIHAIVFDGIVTQRLVDLAESKGVQVLVGGKMGNVNKKPTKLELVIPSKK
ncbi:DNA primase [Candidatus Micrarchaeota archaeon]|nr:DNA primase [Candidatus Micrarchaeota archaeon]MBD3418183.1 DNA primase [Candidatus Micrarchaeota archaeon]